MTEQLEEQNIAMQEEYERLEVEHAEQDKMGELRSYAEKRML